MWLLGGVICNPRDKSCTILLYNYMTLGRSTPNICAFGLLASSSEEFLKISPFWPLSGDGAIYDSRNFICTNLYLLVPRLLYTKYRCIRAFGLWEDIFQIPKISPIVAFFLTPKGTSPLICAHFNPHFTSYQILLKSIQWFWRVSVLNAFPYISLCKMKRPLVEPFFGRFYFYTQTL